MKLAKLSAAVMTVMLLLCGCTGQEPNDISYIVAIGIDRGENGKYKITVQYANPTEISGSENVESEKSGIKNITVEAGDIYQAVGLVDLHDSKDFYLSHTIVIIFSKSVAEEGLEKMTELFMNSEDLRPDIYLAVADDAQKYLEEINPPTEVNPAKYYRQFFDKNKLTGLPQGTQKDFFCGIQTGDYDTLLPVVEAHTTEFNSAVFCGGKMTGILNEQETALYKFMDRNYTSGYLTLQNDTTLKEPVTIRVAQRKVPKYDFDLENRKLTISLTIGGNIYSTSSYDIENGIEDFRKNCEDHLEKKCKELIEKVINEYHSDILRFNEQAKAKFLTYSDYEQYKNSVNYGEFDISVEINFDVVKTGLVQRSS